MIVYKRSHFVAILLSPVHPPRHDFTLPIDYVLSHETRSLGQADEFLPSKLYDTPHTLSHKHTNTVTHTHHLQALHMQLQVINEQQQPSSLAQFSLSLPISLSLIWQRKWLYYYAQTILGAALPTVCVLHIILIKVNSLRAKRKQKQKESKQRQTQNRNSVWIQMKIRNSRTATAADERAKKGRDREWGKREACSGSDKWTRHWVMTVLLTVWRTSEKGGSSAKGLQGLRPGQGQRQRGGGPARSSGLTLPAVIQVLVK